MLLGSDHLAAAREVLVRTGLPARERLVTAWPMFWKSVFYEPHWPAVLQRRSKDLVERLLADGEVAATVAAMSESEAQDLARDMQRFIDDFHRHGSAPTDAEIRIEPLDRKPDEINGH